MNSKPLDQRTFESIEAYVLGTMSPTDRETFEARMRQDTILRAEVEQQQEHIRAVELGGLERTLRVIAQEHDLGAEKRSGWATYQKYAALVAVVLGAVAWFATRPTTGERLFAEHFTPDPGLPVAMSATTDLAFQDAMVDYKMKEFAVAQQKWNQQLRTRPTSDTLRYFSAMAAMAANDLAAAVPLLDAVAGQRSSPFADKAAWYLFLAHTCAGDTSKAGAIRFNPGSPYAARAEAIQRSSR